MTISDQSKDRKIIPRWHSLAASSKQGELAALFEGQGAAEAISEEQRELALAEHRADWRENQSLPFAEDFISAVVSLGVPEEGHDAAALVLATPGASPLATAVARHILAPEDEEGLDEDEHDPFGEEEELRRSIARLKHRLREDPRAALSWAEIARCYAGLGQASHAGRAMEIALSFAPDDRFLLRSAARLSVHLDEPDRGHRLLANALRLRDDPWLLSAEIAIAPLAGRTSRHHGHAKRVLESGRFLPHATSELASALGTEALRGGDTRRVRRLMEASLEQPTENAVAQAVWVSGQERGFVFDSDVLDDVEDTFEARANYLALQGEHVESLINARGWLRDQPFATDPALFGSYRAALIKDYITAIEFARAGLRANPHDYMLQNNLIFALASNGDIEEARERLALLEEATRGKTLENEWDVVVDATRGLIAFRSGDVTTGRATYLDVIRRAKEPSLKVVAMIMLAREEITARTVQATQALEIARNASDEVAGIGGPRAVDLPSWLDHLK